MPSAHQSVEVVGVDHRGHPMSPTGQVHRVVTHARGIHDIGQPCPGIADGDLTHGTDDTAGNAELYIYAITGLSAETPDVRHDRKGLRPFRPAAYRRPKGHVTGGSHGRRGVRT